MIDAERFRDALAGWASGVAVVACRSEQRVIATTVSAFTSLSVDPPLVLVALGPNATVRPYLEPGRRFAINVLSSAHRRLAMIFADPFPVGTSPFPETGDPVIADALAALVCTVDRIDYGGDHVIVIAGVQEASWRDGDPLVRYRRKYHALDS